jgi:ethanolamine utilization protein EutN
MNLGRVVGTIWATRRTDGMDGLPMQMVVPLDLSLEPIGAPFAAVNTVGAGPGDVIFYISAYEACLPLPDPLVPVDRSIIGIVEQVDDQVL